LTLWAKQASPYNSIVNFAPVAGTTAFTNSTDCLYGDCLDLKNWLKTGANQPIHKRKSDPFLGEQLTPEKPTPTDH